MPLFDTEVESIGVRPKRYLEPTFEYYNRSDRKNIQQIKSVLERWFAAYPEDGRSDLRSRFRSKIESQHQASFFELFVHEVLTQLGYRIELHPDVQSTNHPDFLASPEKGDQFLVEVTTTQDSEQEVAAQKRIDQVYDTLNRLRSPDFFIAILDSGSPGSSVPGARVRTDLERWLNGLSWPEVTKAWEKSDGFDAAPRYEWKHDGWEVTFRAIPKSKENRGSADLRPIGLTMPTNMKMLAADEEIKSAIKRKDRYGKPKLPFVLVINVLGDFCDTYDVMNAVFGHETVIFGPEGTRPGARLRDGAWDAPGGPQHKSISAVLVFHALNAWSVLSSDYWLVHNPWADLPLGHAALPFTQYVPNYETGKLEERKGRTFADLLRLPTPWPPDDD